MSQFLETVTETLRQRGLHLIRSGSGRASQFWGGYYGDLFTIRVQEAKPAQPASEGKEAKPAVPESVALTWTITFDQAKTKEKPCPVVLKDAQKKDLQVLTLEDFELVKEEWIARVAAGPQP